MKTVVVVIYIEHPMPHVTVWGASLSYSGHSKFFSGAVGNISGADYFVTQRVLSALSEPVKIDIYTNADLARAESEDLMSTLWMHEFNSRGEITPDLLCEKIDELINMEREHALAVLHTNFNVVQEAIRVFGSKDRFVIFRGAQAELFLWGAGHDFQEGACLDQHKKEVQPMLFD